MTTNDSIQCPFTLNVSYAVDAATLLWMYNEGEASYRYPAIWFSLIILFIGLMGNSLVVYAYGFRFKRTTANVYILFLGIFDMICCFISIPFETFTLRFPLMYGVNVSCKVIRALSVFAYICQSLMLGCIAVDRYFKVCSPLRTQCKTKHWRNLLIVLIAAVILSWPAGFIYGRKTIETCFPEVTGSTCSISDDVKGTLYPTLYYGFHFIVFVGVMVVVSYIYIKIFIKILKWKNSSHSGTTDNQTIELRNCTRSEKISKCLRIRCGIFVIEKCLQFRISTKTEASTTLSEPSTQNITEDEQLGNSSIRHVSGIRNSANVYKTTVVFILVTLTFLISYLPYLVGEFLLKSGLIDFERLSFRMKGFMEVIAKSYCINNATNAIIYSIFNEKFRQEIIRLFWSSYKR